MRELKSTEIENEESQAFKRGVALAQYLTVGEDFVWVEIS